MISTRRKSSKEQKTTEKLKKQRYENNLVIVYIWTSMGNRHFKGENVGHVSIEIPKEDPQKVDGENCYISFWPNSKKEDGLGVVKPIPCRFMENYADDVASEDGRNANVVYCFYTLDRIMIEQAFNELKERITGWNAWGRFMCRDAESCASLAYRVLQVGGIGKLEVSRSKQSSLFSSESSSGLWVKKQHSVAGMAYIFSSETSQAEFEASSEASFYNVEMGSGLIISSPDALVLILEEAKRRELANHPITRSIEYPEETLISSNSGGRCFLM